MLGISNNMSYITENVLYSWYKYYIIIIILFHVKKQCIIRKGKN